MMQETSIAFIGAGNMATAIIAGLCQAKHPAKRILVSNPSAPKLQRLKQHYDVTVHQDNQVVAANADIIVLAVKPQKLAAVCQELSTLPEINHKLIISLAAGVSTKTLSRYFKNHDALARLMPNTPATIGMAMSGAYALMTVTEQQKRVIDYIAQAIGEVIWLSDENLMHTVTAVAGSGPAYFFFFMEAMISGAQQLGLSAQQARQFILQTAKGAVMLAEQSPDTIAELRTQVTSPGGTTAAAMDVLTQQRCTEIIQQAVTAAQQRGIELDQTEKG